MKYNLDYFIAKFEAIPEEKWTTKAYEKDGKYCAVGHCGYRINPDDSVIPTEEGRALFDISEDITIINDGRGVLIDYAPTPKQRVLKHLRALKHMEAKDGKEESNPTEG